jgi:hypothetical protein
MKTILDVVNESIFDDDLEGKLDNIIQIEKIHKKFVEGGRYGVMCRCAEDMMDNPINKGDIVIFAFSNKLYCDCVRAIEEDNKGWKWLVLEKINDLKVAPIQTVRVKNEDVKTFLKIISK